MMALYIEVFVGSKTVIDGGPVVLSEETRSAKLWNVWENNDLIGIGCSLTCPITMTS